MRFSAYIITVIWALLIAVLSFLPGKHFPATHISGLDLIVHFTFYCILTFFLVIGNAQNRTFFILEKYPILSAILLSITYGAFIEIIQGTVFVYRSAEVSDFLANSAGSLVGIVLYLKMYKPLKSRRSWKGKKPPVKISDTNPPNTSL